MVNASTNRAISFRVISLGTVESGDYGTAVALMVCHLPPKKVPGWLDQANLSASFVGNGNSHALDTDTSGIDWQYSYSIGVGIWDFFRIVSCQTLASSLFLFESYVIGYSLGNHRSTASMGNDRTSGLRVVLDFRYPFLRRSETTFRAMRSP